jgi:hypothetical protein
LTSNSSADHLSGKVRIDIHALRGFAVLAVVFYHAKVGVFSAGYLGVRTHEVKRTGEEMKKSRFTESQVVAILGAFSHCPGRRITESRLTLSMPGCAVSITGVSKAFAQRQGSAYRGLRIADRG